MGENNKDIVTEEELIQVKELLFEQLDSYEKKEDTVSDKEWLENLYRTQMPEMSIDEMVETSNETLESIRTFDANLESCNEAAKKGVAKENWLASRMEEATVGLSVNEYGQSLKKIDDFLFQKNKEIAEAISKNSDGSIMMSPNLDGNIAENVIAKTAEMSAFLQGKNVSVTVLESHNANSVDVRAKNLETGQYQNYQLKFGKDAKATIALIERGDYRNQRIIVPKEQLEEVKAYFAEKGSAKTISDRIEAFGVEGQAFSKEEMKKLQEIAQNEGITPELDYSNFHTKDLAKNIGKNAGAMAIQSAAITAGWDLVSKLFRGEKIEGKKVVSDALKNGVDSGIKCVVAGIMQVAARKGFLRVIPKGTPVSIITNIASVVVENVKVVAQIADDKISATKGLDQMGRVTTSLIAGLWASAKGAVLGAKLTAWIPVVGPALAVVTGAIGGIVGYAGGSKVGEKLYTAAKKLATSAKNVAKTVFNEIKTNRKKIAEKLKSVTTKSKNVLSKIGVVV